MVVRKLISVQEIWPYILFSKLNSKQQILKRYSSYLLIEYLNIEPEDALKEYGASSSTSNEIFTSAIQKLYAVRSRIEAISFSPFPSALLIAGFFSMFCFKTSNFISSSYYGLF